MIYDVSYRFATIVWGYALETAAFTLNRAPSKSVETTPYKLWFGKKLSHRFLKFGDAMLMSKGFSLISSNPNRRSADRGEGPDLSMR